jgi:hypothetical protein
MKNIEVFETIEINGKVYPKHKRITYIDEERPTVSKKCSENSDIAEKIFSDENYNSLQVGNK